jgi:hypothetical protein
MKTLQDFIAMGLTPEQAALAVANQFNNAANVATATQTPPALGNLAVGFVSQNQMVLANVNPANEKQIFSPEPRRGVPDSWEKGKVYAVKFLHDDAENSIEWANSGEWEYLQARVIVDHNGSRESIPCDGVQASALFSTFAKDGSVPVFYMKVSMRDRKPDANGNARSPIKVVDLYSKIGCAKQDRISYKSEGGKVVTPFEVIGW